MRIKLFLLDDPWPLTLTILLLMPKPGLMCHAESADGPTLLNLQGSWICEIMGSCTQENKSDDIRR